MTESSSVDPAVAALLFEASLDYVKVLNLSGALESMNRNGQRAMEVDNFESVCGATWDTLWPPQERARIEAAVSAARAGQPDRFIGMCLTFKGTQKWWDVSVSPVFGSDGEVVSIVTVSRDITELHSARRLHEQLAGQLRLVMDSAGIGDWEFDPVREKFRVSPQGARCFGLGEALDESCHSDFLTYIHPDDHQTVAQVLHATIDDGSDLRYEARVVWDDGSVHWIEVNGRHYPTLRGEPVRILGTVREITRRKTAELELKNAIADAMHMAALADVERQRLDALLDAAPVGIAYVDGAGKILRANPANRAIWGEHPLSTTVDDDVEWKAWWADRSPRHGQPIQAHDWGLARALQGEDVRGDLIEIEPFGEPGARKPLLLRASPMRDVSGAVTGAVVVQVDISEQVRAQAELRASEAKFRTIADAMPQMVWSTLPDGYHDYFNAQWYDYTGVPKGSTDGEAWNGIFHPDDQQNAWERWRYSLTTGEAYEIQYRLRHREGAYRWVLGRALPVRDDTGRIVRWMGTCTDIHEHQEQALRDELTGLPNRAAWNEELSRAVARAGRTNLPMVMLFLDLDGLKTVNDLHGHAAGDAVLVNFAALLRRHLRTNDFVARLAGDEFVVLLDGINNIAENPIRIATKIIAAAAEGTRYEGCILNATPSIGIGIQPGPAFNGDLLQQCADEAMYTAKRRGRGQVETQLSLCELPVAAK